MAFTNRIGFAEVLEMEVGDILDAYSPLPATTQIGDVLIIQNLTDIGVMLSFSANLSDNLPVPPNGFILLDLNKFVTEENTSLAKGTIINAKRLASGAAGTTGSLWVSIMYSARR